jgi:L-Ala-D/L-Glu epimerase
MMVKARIETFPISGVFAISCETRTEQTVVFVTVSDGHFIGHAECVPHRRCGETPDGAVSDITK